MQPPASRAWAHACPAAPSLGGPACQFRVGSVSIDMPTHHDEPIPPLATAYVERFRRLLDFEERQMADDMRLYRMYQVQLAANVDYDSVYELRVPGLQEWRPPSTYGDVVRLRCAATPEVAYDGFVYNVDRVKEVLFIVLRLPVELQEALDDVRFNVDFVVNRTALIAMRRALRTLDEVPTGSVVESVTLWQARPPQFHGPRLQPVRPVVLPAQALTDQELNWEQRHAVTSALAQAETVSDARTTAFGRMTIVFGPPGTGKTRTLVEMVVKLMLRLQHLYPVAPPGRLGPPAILLTAPSNQAVDILVARLAPFVKPAEMLRLNGAPALGRRRCVCWPDADRVDASCAGGWRGSSVFAHVCGGAGRGHAVLLCRPRQHVL